MKTKLVLSAILGLGLLGLSLPTLAAKPASNTQKYSAQFTLTPTEAAPQGASGKAQINREFKNDTQTASASLQTIGLDPGDYSVIAVTSDGPVELGQITIEDSGHGKGKLKSISQTEIPEGVDARDITQLIISDTNGVDMLVGDLTAENTKSKASYSAKVPLIPGEAAPDASGTVKLKSSVKKGQFKSSFLLNASGVPADSTFTLKINGIEDGTVTSTSKGKVTVKQLPEGTTTVDTVELVDENGASVVSAQL